MNKSGSHVKCLAHCIVYTTVVAFFTAPFITGWMWWLIIFLSHYPIDRWSLADKWLNWIGARSLKDFMFNGKKNIPEEFDAENYHGLRAGFTSLVYCVADNTMHLILMYYGAMLCA